MNSVTREWVDKAEADFAAALLLRRSRKKHSRDIVSFHLQQCVEKYLKARLQEAQIAYPKTHDLEKLLQLVVSVEPTWTWMRPDLVMMTTCAVEIRYPGRSVSVKDGRMLMHATERIRGLIRDSLGLVP